MTRCMLPRAAVLLTPWELTCFAARRLEDSRLPGHRQQRLLGGRSRVRLRPAALRAPVADPSGGCRRLRRGGRPGAGAGFEFHAMEGQGRLRRDRGLRNDRPAARRCAEPCPANRGCGGLGPICCCARGQRGSLRRHSIGAGCRCRQEEAREGGCGSCQGGGRSDRPDHADDPASGRFRSPVRRVGPARAGAAFVARSAGGNSFFRAPAIARVRLGRQGHRPAGHQGRDRRQCRVAPWRHGDPRRPHGIRRARRSSHGRRQCAHQPGRQSLSGNAAGPEGRCVLRLLQ